MYVGATLSSKRGPTLRPSYATSAAKAAQTAGAVLGLSSHIGNIEPKLGLRLYRSLIEPHLIWLASVSVDSVKMDVRKLSVVQETFLRRILCVSSTCSTSFLFTETGMWPIVFRRLQIALRYLKHLLESDDLPFPKAALRHSFTLASKGSPSGWVHRLRNTLKRLNPLFYLPDWDNLSPESIDELISCVRTHMRETIRESYSSSPKGYIVVARAEFHAQEPFRQTPMAFREYLNIPKLSHRCALTRIITSDHVFALERLRHQKIARQDRLCRMCEIVIESPEHVLFECPVQLARVTNLRLSLKRRLLNSFGPLSESWPALTTLVALLSTPEAVCPLAELCHICSTIWDKKPFIHVKKKLSTTDTVLSDGEDSGREVDMENEGEEG